MKSRRLMRISKPEDDNPTTSSGSCCASRRFGATEVRTGSWTAAPIIGCR